MTSLENRVRRIEDHIRAAQIDARACVRELLVPDEARYLVAERLPALGSIIVPAVRELIDDPATPDEVRTLAALVGVQVGDGEQSAMVLLDELGRRGEFAPLAARRLAMTRVVPAASAISEALRLTPPCNVDAVVAYLEALRDLGVSPTPEERRRLEAEGQWQVVSALAEWHPESEPDS